MKDNSPTPLIYDVDMESFQSLFSSWDEPTYRAIQVWEGLYKHLYDSASQFTNLPQSLREKLKDNFSYKHLIPVNEIRSKDGLTLKTLFRLPDGNIIEAVMMHYHRRHTLCISTQSGCAMGCVFCATGQMGYYRNLSCGEIVEQVLYFARLLSTKGERVTNIVLMGMGEPFHNYEATMQAIDRINHPDGFKLGMRKITISTVGLVPAIRRFSQEKSQVNLSISLHAANDQLRSTLLPVNQRYPLSELFDACLDYITITHRRLSFEWALIQDVNDGLDQAKELSKKLQLFLTDNASLCHVNLIPLNPTHRYQGEGTSRQRANDFKRVLELSGIPCTIRIRRGVDIQAGCGQLALRDIEKLK